MGSPSASTFLGRNEFIIRRLHSLSGLIPVGAYMIVHLLTNASIIESPATYQKAVYQIHGIPALVLVEWIFIFIPIFFHAIIGVVIIKGGLPNNSSYPYGANWRYTLQRATGMLAFVFILFHVLHMHGIIHADWWMDIVKSWGGGQFKPYNAASTLHDAMQGFVVPVCYAIGVLSCVYHLANGIWTMGITWGVWTTPLSQSRAAKVCLVFGIAMSGVGLSAIWGAKNVDREEAIRIEDEMYQQQKKIAPNEHKRSHHEKSKTAKVD